MFSVINNYRLDNLKNKYKQRVKEIKYWDNVERLFAKSKKEKFTQEFKHPIYDNESIIEGLAEIYGYKIVNEVLCSDKSIYTFEKYNKNYLQ